MSEQTPNTRKVRFVPEITLGNVLQLLSLAAVVVGLWFSLDKRISAVELRGEYPAEERRAVKKRLATLADNQAVLARTVDRLSILFEQREKGERSERLCGHPCRLALGDDSHLGRHE